MSIDVLLAPFEFVFMQRAFLISLMIALPMAVLSCYIVLKGWSLMGDAIAHAVLPGIVLAYLLALPLAVGAFVAGISCAGATSYIKNNTKLREDTVMGIVFSTLFALGVVLFHAVDTDLHLTHLLLGDLLGGSESGLWYSAALSSAVMSVLLLRQRDLLLLIFDPIQAQICGLNLAYWRYVFQALLALTIVAALQSVGMILAVAMLITPGACALLLSKQFTTVVRIAVIIAMSCSLLGVYASFFLDAAPAPTIVMFMTLVFVIIFTSVCIKSYFKKQRSVTIKKRVERFLHRYILVS